MTLSTKDLDRLQSEGKIRGYTETFKAPAPSKNKMGNKIVEFDGIKFRSKKELARFIELRMLVTIGEVTELRLQVPYELNEGGTHSYKYLADFVYIRNGIEVVEDSKGYKTVLYKKKRKLMKKLFNIEILET